MIWLYTANSPWVEASNRDPRFDDFYRPQPSAARPQVQTHDLNVSNPLTKGFDAERLTGVCAGTLGEQALGLQLGRIGLEKEGIWTN